MTAKGLSRLAVVVAGALGTCAAGCAGPTALANVAYDDRFGAATTMDVYLPAGGGPAPLVVFIHGGLFRTGDKGEYQKGKRPAEHATTPPV